MKRLTAIAVLTLGLLVASWARADWNTIGGLDGGPVDSWIADANGWFAIHTNTTAYQFVDNGAGITQTGLIAGLSSPKCTAIDANGHLRHVAQFGVYDEVPPGTFTGSGTISTSGCRATENLAGLGFGVVSAVHYSLSGDAGTFGQTWISNAGPGTTGGTPTAVSAKSIFGREYGLIPRGNTAGTYFMVDGTVVTPLFQTSTLNPIQRTEIFGARDGGVRAVMVGGDAGELLTLQPGGVVAESFSLPPSVPGVFALRGATLSELEGDQFGAGFGMLMVDSPGSLVGNVWSAIPDPDNVGRFWVPSSVQPTPPAASVYDSVRCRDAKLCVLGSKDSPGPTGPQLAVYRNVHPPSIIRPAFVVLEEDPAMQTFTVDAGDDDGDAIFMTWLPDPGAGNYLNPFNRDGGVRDGTTWQGRAIPNNSLLCRLDHVDIPLTVVASDGLYKSQDSGTITVIHTKPGAPGNRTTVVQAGTIPQPLTLPFTPNLCPPFTTNVRTVPSGTPNGVAISGSNVIVTYTPPRTWCDDTAGSGTKEIYIRIEDGAAISPEGIATFIVTPWGEPEPPFGGGSVVFQDAGTTVTYQPSATHLCGDAGSFPGVDTFWTWFATGFTPMVLQADGGLLPPSGGFSSTATVSVPDCQTSTINFQVTNTTHMDGGLTSPDSGLTVNVATSLQTLAGTLLMTAIPDAGSVSGTLDLSGVQCQSLRSINGTVDLVRKSDGGFISSVQVPVPGPYMLQAMGDACGGGTFTVRATATDVSGGVLTAVPQDVDLPLLVAGFDQVTVPDFQITCRDVARSRGATVTFLPTQCSSAQVDWTSTGAVAIAPTSGNPMADLETVSSDFNGLIGLPVFVTATATAVTGMVSQDAGLAIVRTAPFVSVVHRTDTAVASESRVLSVEVQLTNNTTSCDVSGVEWHESLNGMSWIDGSVTGADGGGMAARLDDGGVLVVPGLSLPVGQPVTFRYSARPTLFGQPSPNGWATLRTVPISDGGGLTPGNPTCGCQSGSSGVTALAGLLAAALLRKRRLRARS